MLTVVSRVTAPFVRIRRDEGLTVETSAPESLKDGQITFIKPNIRVNHSPKSSLSGLFTATGSYMNLCSFKTSCTLTIVYFNVRSFSIT